MAKCNKYLQQELEEQLRFETLLTEISANFVNLPSDRIDAAIKDAQRGICEFLHLDRSVLWKIIETEPNKMLLTHIHQPLESLLPDSPFNADDYFPWIFNKLFRGETVTVVRLRDLPREADRDRESLKNWGNKSAIAVPMSVGGKLVGALSFGSLQEETLWQERIVKRIQLVAQIFTNALVRKQAEDSLEERLRFETLLAEISAHFVNLPADRIDDEIEQAQRRICECLGLEMSILWQWTDDTPRFLTITHFHSPPGGTPRPHRMDAKEAVPWILEKMLCGELLTISTDDLPPEAARDRETRLRYGIKSAVTIPLSIGGGALIGVLTFNALKEKRSWPEAIVRRLRLVAQIFTNALVRRRGELELRETEERLNMATEAAGVGLWVMDSERGRVWVTPKTRELFHFAEAEELNYKSFFKMIHPDDQERVYQAVQTCIQSGDAINIEYRIILPDRSIRWIIGRGKRFLRSNGNQIRLMGVSIDISERRQMEEQLRAQLEEIESLRQKLEKENIYLREEIELRHVHGEIVGRSPAMMRILAQVEQVAQTDSTVLIEGETGAGKELLARAVHRLSLRKDRPLVTVNCASLPPALIESELFGREKGAYTGAMTRMAGRFEVADGATLFLDEIGEIPFEVQSKLLRVLEEGRFERLGSSRTVQVDVRIIAATNQNLAQQAASGKFRKDLYFRLNVFPIFLPPLRERTDDIPQLVWTFVREYEKKIGRRVEHIPLKCMQKLQSYAWPGNVRELKNVIERAMIVCSDRTLELYPPPSAFSEIPEELNLEDAERRHILSVLKQTGWRVSGQGGAAKILGLKRTTLQSKMKKLGIRRLPE